MAFVLELKCEVPDLQELLGLIYTTFYSLGKGKPVIRN